MTTYPLTRCSVPGQRTGLTGRSHHLAAMTTARLSVWCVRADNVMSFCGRLYEQAQVKQSRGCQEATYLHYLIFGSSDVAADVVQ